MSIAVTIVALLPLPLVAKRRPVGTPLTWGEALLAGTYIFFLFWWAYGIIPHLWLTYADNELGWRSDAILWGPGNIFRPQSQGGWLPLTITKQVLRDIIVVGLYVAYLALPIALWAWWQKRGERAAAKPESDTTVFGRPLVREGA